MKTPAAKSAFFLATLQGLPDLSGFQNLTGLVVLLLKKLDLDYPVL